MFKYNVIKFITKIYTEKQIIQVSYKVVQVNIDKLLTLDPNTSHKAQLLSRNGSH